MMSSPRKWLILFLVAAVLIAAILYVFDLAFSPYRRLPPNGTVDGVFRTWGYPVETNRFGFRERDFAAPKPSGVFRVMVLGDSLTWGGGLRADQRYTAVCEEWWQMYQSGRKAEILNFGIIGSPTTVQRDTLKRYGPIVQPDLVVVGFCFNDTQTKSQYHSAERERVDRSLPGRAVAYLSSGLRQTGLIYTSKLIYDGFYRLMEMVGRVPVWPDALDRTYDKTSPEWKNFCAALREIKDEAERLTGRPPLFAVLNQGFWRDRPTDYGHPDANLERYLRWYHRAEAAAREIGFFTYNHEEEIARELKDRPLSVNAVDGHPSAELNRVYGEKLYRELETALLADP
jgi:lysophospholipase L1-like esterase